MYRWVLRLVRKHVMLGIAVLIFVQILLVNQAAISTNTKAWSGSSFLRWIFDSPDVCIPQTLNVSDVFSITGDSTNHFVVIKNFTCFKEGTRITQSGQSSTCVCAQGWYGKHCSIPYEVTVSNLPANVTVLPRIGKPGRKVINAFPFNEEFAMLDARFSELFDVVDVFVILESNYTAHGDAKPLYLLDKLRCGAYQKYLSKIVHVFLDHFPPKAKTNGWLADDILRDHIAQQGLKNQLRNFSSNDIFLMTDADELPYRSSVQYLKFHDGYPVPVGYFLSDSSFGFFWKGRKSLHVICASTVGLLTKVFQYKAIQIRTAPYYLKGRHKEELSMFMKAANNMTHVGLWSFGSKTSAAGWHCSSCCPPECIRNKLLSAQNGDFPRWGDYANKTNTTYIRAIVGNGTWFDNKSKFTPRRLNETANYAPKYLLDNFDKYKDILVNPYT